LIERRKVDFPQPDGPMRAVIARGRIESVMSNRACFSPYQNEKCLALIVPSFVGSVGGSAIGFSAAA
jgi:hypothetical protein